MFMDLVTYSFHILSPERTKLVTDTFSKKFSNRYCLFFIAQLAPNNYIGRGIFCDNYLTELGTACPAVD